MNDDYLKEKKQTGRLYKFRLDMRVIFIQKHQWISI